MHQNGVNGIVSYSKSQNFKNPSHFRDLNDMYLHILSRLAASREKIEKLEQEIEAEMMSLESFVTEEDAALGGRSSKYQKNEADEQRFDAGYQNTEDDDEILIIEQPKVTIEVPSDDEDGNYEPRGPTETLFAENVSSPEENIADEILYKEVKCEPPEEDDSFADEMAYEDVAMDSASGQNFEAAMESASTSGQNFEVFQGFTIETLEPKVELEEGSQPCTSIKREPTDFESEIAKTQLRTKILRPRVNPFSQDRSRIDKLRENLRQKLKKATKPTSLADYIRASKFGGR